MNKIILSVVAVVGAVTGLFADPPGKNLMPNPEFKKNLDGWGVDASIVRRVEPVALSGEYVMRATGGGTHHLFSCTSVTDWTDDEDYTLVVEMRSVGAGSAIWITQGGSKKREGRLTPDVPTYLAMNVGVDGEWHEYFFPFHTPKGLTPWGFQFRKVDSGGDDTGIEFKSIKLYRGKLSSFDIRRIVRAGRQAPVAGTELPLAPSRYGAATKPMRVFAAVGHYNCMREVQHLFAGTGDTLDLVVALSRGGDVYLSDCDGAEIKRRLRAGEYDVYMIARDIADRIGPELSALIADGVKKGAGLYCPDSAKDCPFAAVLKEARAAEDVGTCQSGNLRLGKGRVLRLAKDDPRNEAPGGKAFEWSPRARLAREGLEDFPYTAIVHAEINESVRRLAWGETPKPVRERREETVYAGERHVETWGLDAAGKTLSYRHAAEPVMTVRLGAFTDDGAVARVAIEGSSARAVLRWSFSDFAGRVFGEGEEKVGRESRSTEDGKDPLSTSTSTSSLISLSLPREKLYTNFGLLTFELVDARGKRLDRRNEAIYVAGNDRMRLLDDYTMAMWPMSGQTSFLDMPDYFRMLEKLGFRASFMPAGGLSAWSMPFRAGIAPSAGYLCGGTFFTGSPKAKDNVLTYSPNTKGGRDSIRATVRRVAKDAASYGVFMAPLSDEPQLSPLDQETDEHPENVAEYRRRMAARYGTIDAYNRAHHTQRASFDEIGPARIKEARAAGNVAEFVEWRRYNVDKWVEVIRFAGDEARKIIPDLKYSLDNSFGESAFYGNDYWKLLSRGGLDFSREYTSMVHFSRNPREAFDEVYRSFSPDMRCWGWIGYGMTAEHQRFYPWWYAAHRYGGFTWFTATYWTLNLIDVPSGAMTVHAKECAETFAASRLGEGLGRILTNWRWNRRDIAIYYSYDSMLVSTFLGKEEKSQDLVSGGPLDKMLKSRLYAQYLVEDLLYQHDYVSYEQVADGKLVKDGYKVLFMPHVIAMSEAEVAAVKAFVKAGGTVIADVLPGDCDELGIRREAIPFEEVKAKVKGEDEGEGEGEGEGAGKRRKGSLLVTGEPFSDLDPKQRAATLGRLQKAGATRALASSTAVANFGREAMHYVSGDADLYVVLRKSGRSTDDAADSFAFAREGCVYDVRARKSLGRRRELTTKVPLHEASVFAVLPAPVKGIEVKVKGEGEGEGEGTVKTGTDLTAELSVNCAAKGVAWVLHTELVPPTGERRFLYDRNLDAPDGKVRLVFPIALNDPAGEWTLRVVEPLSGVTAERKFRVR